MSRVERGPGPGRARPVLVFDDRQPAHPRGVVLMLHGGQVDDVEPLRRFDPSPFVVRMMTNNLRKRSPDLAFVRLLNAVGGWNEPTRSPVADAQWALMRLQQIYPGLPIALVGHSMGGRTAFELADADGVRAVVGLAPWLADAFDEKRFLGVPTMVVHGRADTVTSEEASADLIRRIRLAGGWAIYLSVPGWHSLAWRAWVWQRQVASFLNQHLNQHLDQHLDPGSTHPDG